MAMTKAQLRVAVAKDALSQLQAKQYTARTGTYCELDVSVPRKGMTSKLFQEFLRSKWAKCDVCAKGALFISTVRKDNKFRPGEDIIGSTDIDEHDFGDRLSSVFPQRNLDLIEAAFERDAAFAEGDEDGEPSEEAYAAAEMYDIDDHDKRLVAILKNIVKNKGTFVVPVKGKAAKVKQ